MHFRVTVRDGRIGSGAAAWADTSVIVDDASGPFTVTAPAAGARWKDAIPVTWNVAGTAAAPVNAGQVSVRLSTDGGKSCPYLLAAGTANDGAETLPLPAVASAQARIKIEAVGNIFFNISPEFEVGMETNMVPVIRSVALSESKLVLSWKSVRGRSYRPQSKADVRGDWRDLDHLVIATGSVANAELNLPDVTQSFFRIWLVPEKN
jgi:hypothetical protein